MDTTVNKSAFLASVVDLGGPRKQRWIDSRGVTNVALIKQGGFLTKSRLITIVW